MTLVTTAQTALIRKYSADHPEAIGWGWFSSSSPAATALVYTMGQSWGGPPLSWLEANAPTVNPCAHVQAIVDEANARGWDVWLMGYPRVDGSPGATLQQGSPGDWLMIRDLLSQSLGWLRSRGYTELHACGRSAGGISWGSVASLPSTFDRPDGLLMIESCPALAALSDSANLNGAGAYCTGVSTLWPSVPPAAKLAPSVLPYLNGAGGDVPYVACYRPDDTLAGVASYEGALSVLNVQGPGYVDYTMPHDSAGGALLEDGSQGRAAPYLVRFGSAAILDHPTGQYGIASAGTDPAFAVEALNFLEA